GDEPLLQRREPPQRAHVVGLRHPLVLAARPAPLRVGLPVQAAPVRERERLPVHDRQLLLAPPDRPHYCGSMPGVRRLLPLALVLVAAPARAQTPPAPAPVPAPAPAPVPAPAPARTSLLPKGWEPSYTLNGYVEAGYTYSFERPSNGII